MEAEKPYPASHPELQKQVVCILLECFLVYYVDCTVSTRADGIILKCLCVNSSKLHNGDNYPSVNRRSGLIQPTTRLKCESYFCFMTSTLYFPSFLSPLKIENFLSLRRIGGGGSRGDAGFFNRAVHYLKIRDWQIKFHLN